MFALIFLLFPPEITVQQFFNLYFLFIIIDWWMYTATISSYACGRNTTLTLVFLCVFLRVISFYSVEQPYDLWMDARILKFYFSIEVLSWYLSVVLIFIYAWLFLSKAQQKCLWTSVSIFVLPKEVWLQPMFCKFFGPNKIVAKKTKQSLISTNKT